MKLVPNLKHTALRDLVQGELGFCAFTNGPGLVLALSAGEETRKAFCAIPLEENKTPWLILSRPGDRTEDVLSYGPEWVLEVRPDEHSRPGNYKIAEMFGAITLAPAGPLLCVRENDHTLGVLINLAKCEVDREPQRGWPTLNWRIWASEADRLQHRSDPLVVCKIIPTRN